METDRPFGDYAPAPQSNLHLEEDTPYSVMVKSCRPVYDGDTLKQTQDGKYQADVIFLLDADSHVRRRFTISYGQNSANKKWAAWAEFLEAVTGIKCGDPAQRKLRPSEIEGKTCKIYVEPNERGYWDVVKTKPVRRLETVPPSAAPADDRNPFDDEPDDELPF